ncbi:MAG: Nramp family divalent metal transporter [Elusimicrobia bacterium]|nr:Nramp family divalent metal transporter [Elusimicrobiota bacterium]
MPWLRGLIVRHRPQFGALDILKYIGPGFLVTVGFIDPGNWATGLAAGAGHGYQLLWVVTAGTLLLILLQHNAAHLGIVTGLCLSESMSQHMSRRWAPILLATGVLAAAATALAELVGAAIGLNMLVGLPLRPGAALTAAGVVVLLYTNSYRRVERWIIGCVGLVGLAFIYELALVRVDWGAAARGAFLPAAPLGSGVLILALLGAVVMPHNLYLHSEIIQSRQCNLEDDAAVRQRLSLEFVDTLAAMGLGWAINCAMIILAATVFFAHGVAVTELPQAQATLAPLLGRAAGLVFALGLLFSGVASTLTAAMAGGSIFAGIFGEPYHVSDHHSRVGIALTLGGGLAAACLPSDPFKALIWSQVALSLQLPFTVIPLVVLTSSRRVMGNHSNPGVEKALLWTAALVVSLINLLLVRDALR